MEINDNDDPKVPEETVSSSSDGTGRPMTEMDVTERTERSASIKML